MRPSALVLAYHGCDRSVATRLVSGRHEIKPSANTYDWLGHGSHFWENNPQRALDWAQFLREHPGAARSKVEKPSVVGAVIELGNCLDLTEAESLGLVREAYQSFVEMMRLAETPLPENRSVGSRDQDMILRNLDCAVINWLHELRAREGLEPFDTVRGAFSEGQPLYAGAGIMEKTHIQICVRHPRQIRGFFVPRN